MRHPRQLALSVSMALTIIAIVTFSGTPDISESKERSAGTSRGPLPQVRPGQMCVQPSPDIIAWWLMDETSGTIVEDIVGQNTGTHVNAPVHAEGIVGNALRFDGNDYVT